MSRRAYWVTFDKAAPVCAWVETEDRARELAATARPGATVKEVRTLPYPARPRVDAHEGWNADNFPSFCYAPNECVGRTSCPQRAACTE